MRNSGLLKQLFKFFILIRTHSLFAHLGRTNIDHKALVPTVSNNYFDFLADVCSIIQMDDAIVVKSHFHEK